MADGDISPEGSPTQSAAGRGEGTFSALYRGIVQKTFQIREDKKCAYIYFRNSVFEKSACHNARSTFK